MAISSRTSFAVSEALEPALVDEAPRADAFDLLEDRAGARVPVEPRVARAAPAQVLLQDAMHRGGVARRQLERRREHDVVAVVEDAVIVAEADVVLADRLPLPLGAQDLARLEHLLDEHRALALGRGGEEVQVLPDGAPDRARDPDVVLESRPAAAHGFEDEVAHDRAALHPEAPVLPPARV